MNEESRELLRGLARLADELGPALAPAGLDELLRSITSAARELFGAAACSLALLDETESELVFHVASGAGAEEVVGLRVPVGQGIAGWVVFSGQPIAIADVRREPRFAVDVAEQTGYVPSSILAMPLETERAMLGVIEVLDRREGGARDMELLGVFARQAALAIEYAQVFDGLGRVLLDALANATSSDELGTALREVAGRRQGRSADLADLAASFSEVARLGDAERRAALSVLAAFASYARTRHRG